MTPIADADPALVVALGTAVKGTALNKAKAAIDPNTNRRVTLNAKITGQLTKEEPTPAASGTKPAAVDLCTFEVMLGVMSALGIGKQRLQAALSRLVEDIEQPDELQVVLDHVKAEKLRGVVEGVAADLNQRLPEQPFDTPERAGAVRFKPDSIHFFETPPCPSSKAA